MTVYRRLEGQQIERVASLAQEHGVLWHHCTESRLCLGNPGLPDLILAGPGGVMFPELKDDMRHMRPAQTHWRWMLRAGRVNTPIWLPSQFRNGTVEASIAALGVGPALTGDTA